MHTQIEELMRMKNNLDNILANLKITEEPFLLSSNLQYDYTTNHYDAVLAKYEALKQNKERMLL